MGIRHRQRRTIGSVRIIGGRWRGRKLPVPDAPGLRPSGDRVRETLFNWLQPHIQGARCADLFAGTGALGFEAASRGAGEVTLVERSANLADVLRHTAESLQAANVQIVHADALDWLGAQAPGSLDIIFVDPPFDTHLGKNTLERVSESRALASGGLVYLESPRADAQSVPGNFLVAREKLMGGVRLSLLEWQGED